MERLICFAGLIIGYFFGCMVAAFFVGTAKKVDIRKKGSGNLGTTNAFRTVGIGGGIATGVGDMLKVVIVVLLVYFVVVKGVKVDIDRIPLYLYTGFGAILGHDFPFYLHFKGGKGVAPSAALLIMLGDWKMIVIGVVIFFGICVLTRYVSLASLSMMTAECILFIVFLLTGLIKVSRGWYPDCIIIMVLMTLLVFWTHRENLKRLAQGKENKFSFKKKA
ncbi:MAG: glycerol-3-phosphate acyltransferase [Lachnospiraceae bacterium]|nr:glycerol-3-phosphate acyltransferase [Lachnospiraceae bacterium]